MFCQPSLLLRWKKTRPSRRWSRLTKMRTNVFQSMVNEHDQMNYFERHMFLTQEAEDCQRCERHCCRVMRRSRSISHGSTSRTLTGARHALQAGVEERNTGNARTIVKVVIQFDYQFWSEDNSEHNDDKPRLATSLTMVDSNTGAIWSTVVPRKGRWQYVEIGAANWLKSLGHTTMALQSDSRFWSKPSETSS